MKYFGHKNNDAVLSGGALIADYLSAATNLSTMETAKYMAQQSEQAILQVIEGVGSAQSNQMTPTLQSEMVQRSLDAHVKKVQAEKISEVTIQETTQSELMDSQQYRGRKVIVSALGNKMPFESVWWDERTGQYTFNSIRNAAIKGTIEEISLSKNILVLRPLFLSRTFTPGRKFFMVHVIDYATLQPAVSMHIL